MRKVEELSNPTSCLNKAQDGEWLFVLLGRDVAAPLAVRAWIEARIRLGKNQRSDAQIVDAQRWIVQVLMERGVSANAAPADLQPVNEEEQELCDAAVRAVLATVRASRASGKYAAYAWLGETEENQVHHAFEHVRELEKKYGDFTMFKPNEDHLAHLLTRGAILQAKIARRPPEPKA